MSNKAIPFPDRVRLSKKTILYELMPPPKNLSKNDIESSISTFCSITQTFPIDGINIPEVREETRNGHRRAPGVIKVEPKIIAKYLKKNGVSNLIINRPVVYSVWKDQEKWFEKIYFKDGVRNVILVGGERSDVKYPGLSVVDSARKLKDKFSDIFLGGITIPTRQNEPERVFKKSEAGIEFFTSQILYDSKYIKNFLKDYFRICTKRKVLPKMIFLSFAPVSTPKDIELLSWLGVAMSKDTIKYLQRGWFGMGFRSLDLCLDIFEDILGFVADNKIEVPIGLNVEHINRHNFESSFTLLSRLCKLYLGKSDERQKFSYI